MDSLTVVVPYRDNPDALRRLLDSLPTGLPSIVVDDCSETPLALERPGVTVIRRETRGYFAGAVNDGIRACDTDVLICNQDIQFVAGGWLKELDKLRRDYAIIGDAVMDNPAWPQGYVQGTMMFVRRDVIGQMGMLDERDWPLWGGTAEWQLRACRAGFSVYPIAKCHWITHERGDKPHGSSIAKLLAEQPERRDLYIRTPPLISVVTACYNYGRYLSDWLASLIGGPTCLGEHPGQTFQGFEAVICDDCSTDDSWAVAKRLADSWRGIRAVRQTRNTGTAATLNAAIRHSHGRYIMVVDADDMLEPTALKRFLREIEAQPHSMIYCDLRAIRDSKRAEVWSLRAYDFEALLQRNQQVPSGIMFSRAAWKEVGGYPEAFARGRQDWAMAVALGAKGYCGRKVKEPLYLYRRHAQNRTLTNMTGVHYREFLAQMKATFPSLYNGGERPMGCCGGRGARLLGRAAPAPKLAPAPMPGSNGMVLLEYSGPNMGRQVWLGPVTNTRYTFKGSRRRFYADNRDVADMLLIVDDHMRIFRRVPIEPVEEAVPVEVEEPVVV